MTNIRDKLRPQREAKVKFETGHRNNFKAKDKICRKKTANPSTKCKISLNGKTIKKSPPIKLKKSKISDSLSNKGGKKDMGRKSKNVTEPLVQETLKQENGPDLTEENIKSSPLKPRPHKCETCGKAFLGKNDLRKHDLIHSGLKPFACPHCSKAFRQAGNLKNHVTSYHSNVIDNPSVYVCDHCSKAFLIKERLRLHMRIHTGHKPYSCRLCPMRFARLGQVRQHSRTHTGERNFACERCPATFTCAAKLKLHIKGHFDVRDHTCYLCGKSFIRPDAIKKHLACFHNGEKPFRCPVCQKSLKGHLQEHLRTHEAARPHGCAECGSRFAQRSQLTVHQRTHSGARPYRCRVCWLAFAHSTALKLHTRRHTGEKPFSCHMCSSAFAQLPHLKKHMQGVHGEGRVYRHNACGASFRVKMELERHVADCERGKSINGGDETDLSPEERLSRRVAAAHRPVDPPMALTKMRLLLAVLLKKISSNKRLEELGFNKRLIDDILIESLESSGNVPCRDDSQSPAERLKRNVQLLLDWTVPPHFMDKFRNEQRSTEELLEELTS